MNDNHPNDLSALPPENTVFDLHDITLEVLDGDHPFEVSERDATKENWEKEIAANPALFDGRMLLQHRVSVDGFSLRGQGYLIPFSTFMWWRKNRHDGFHLFSYPVIVSSDGALIAVRMGKQTANAGQVYFACGAIDANDIVDKHCDIESNMRREVAEETGLDLTQAEPEAGYHAFHFRNVVTLFRLFHFSLTADEIILRIKAHMLVDEEQEIDAAVAIRSDDPTAQPYNVAMLPVMSWYFGRKT